MVAPVLRTVAATHVPAHQASKESTAQVTVFLLFTETGATLTEIKKEVY